MNTLESPPPQELPLVPIYNKLCPADKKWLYQLLTSIETFTDLNTDDGVKEDCAAYLSNHEMPSAMRYIDDYTNVEITLVEGNEEGDRRLVRIGVEQIPLMKNFSITYVKEPAWSGSSLKQVVRYKLYHNDTVYLSKSTELRHFDILFSPEYPKGITLFDLTKAVQDAIFRVPQVTTPAWEFCVPPDCAWNIL